MKRGIPINIETRGSGGDFQQLGVLSKDTISNDQEDSPGNNTDSVILPLYGKPTYRGSNRYLYYTETDKYNPVKVPINYKDRDCTDDQGCDEIYDGDQVTIPSYNGVFNVKIYKLNKPNISHIFKIKIKIIFKELVHNKESNFTIHSIIINFLSKLCYRCY